MSRHNLIYNEVVPPIQELWFGGGHRSRRSGHRVDINFLIPLSGIPKHMPEGGTNLPRVMNRDIHVKHGPVDDSMQHGCYNAFQRIQHV